MASETAIRADAILAELELTEAAERDACIVLADVALRLAGGDPDAAREPLAEALRAIGALPYEAGGVTTMWGTRPKRPGGDEDRDAP